MSEQRNNFLGSEEEREHYISIMDYVAVKKTDIKDLIQKLQYIQEGIETCEDSIEFALYNEIRYSIKNLKEQFIKYLSE